MPTFLTVEERQQAIKILENLYDISETPTTRRTLVENAGLHRFVGGLSFSTNQRTFAGQLINVTENFGPLPEKPNSHALGALFSYVLDLGELPPDSAATLAGLVVKYTLVADADYLQALRQKYNITVDATPPPEAPAPVSLKKLDAEPAPDFAAPEADEEALEKVINSEDNFLDIYLLAGAMYSAQAVGRIERPEGTALGTGFLIGPNLLLTNQHVLKKQEQLEDAVIRFGYQIGASKVAEGGRVFRFDPGFYHASPPEELDFALVKLTEEPLADVKLEVQPNEGLPPFTELLRLGRHRGYLPLGAREITKGERVNIIQHPRGLPQKVVLTLNYVVKDMSATRVHYLADTDPGSSGSPVFNSNWEVVALHHSGNPVPPLQLSERMALQLQGKTLVNEGIPMRAIIKEIEARKLERFLPR
jgi:V8-like Glu-specific endopeptidase